MAPTFPCPCSHSALVHSSRQTDGGPSSCTSSSSARTSLETPTHSLTCPRSLSYPRLSICLSRFPSSLSNQRNRARSLFFLLYSSLCIRSLSVSFSLSPRVRTLLLSSSLFTTTLPAPASAV